jgi:hypothetical protein
MTPKRGETSDSRGRNKSPDFCCSRRGLPLISFRRPVSIGCSNRFVLLAVSGQNTIGFLTPETSVRKKKIPEWKWGRSAAIGSLEIDPPPPPCHTIASRSIGCRCLTRTSQTFNPHHPRRCGVVKAWGSDFSLQRFSISIGLLGGEGLLRGHRRSNPDAFGIVMLPMSLRSARRSQARRFGPCTGDGAAQVASTSRRSSSRRQPPSRLRPGFALAASHGRHISTRRRR